MFEIASFLPVKGKSFNVRKENHGDALVPCVDWRVVAEVSNEWLQTLDKVLKPQFYRPLEDSDDAAKTPHFEDFDLPMPVLRNAHLKYPVPLAYDFAGYELTVDRGLGGKSNIVLRECKLNAFTLDCKEGGTSILSFRIQAQDVSEEARGMLSSYIKGAATAIMLKPPQEKQAAIDGTTGHPGVARAKGNDDEAPAPTGHEAGDTFAANEAAGKNKPGKAPPVKKPRAKKTAEVTH